MKATFTVTIEGTWLEKDKPVTQSCIETALRRAVREEFEFLADKVTVKRVQQASTEKAQG